MFERFFSEWQCRGYGAITAARLEIARTLFAEIVEDRLATLPETEAAIERTRLLGSPVAPGLADVVFRMEAERPVEVVERLLEYRLKGAFEFAGATRSRTILLDGVADRLDLLADGTMRLIDYKLSSAPQRSRALQLPVYAVCAEQRLDGYPGNRQSVLALDFPQVALLVGFRALGRYVRDPGYGRGRDHPGASQRLRL